MTFAAVAAIGSASPLAAETVYECQQRVLKDCTETLEGARWYEKVAVGWACTVMLVSCGLKLS